MEMYEKPWETNPTKVEVESHDAKGQKVWVNEEEQQEEEEHEESRSNPQYSHPLLPT